MFRASQLQQQSSPSLPNAPLFMEHVVFDDGQRFDFHHLSTDRADGYKNYMPSVRSIIRIVAVPCPFVLDEDEEPTNILKPTWFEPTWFSCHVYWEWIEKGEVEKRGTGWQRAAVDVCRERIIEYISLHEELLPTEEYDPIVLEIY